MVLTKEIICIFLATFCIAIFSIHTAEGRPTDSDSNENDGAQFSKGAFEDDNQAKTNSESEEEDEPVKLPNKPETGGESNHGAKTDEDEEDKIIQLDTTDIENVEPNPDQPMTVVDKHGKTMFKVPFPQITGYIGNQASGGASTNFAPVRPRQILSLPYESWMHSKLSTFGKYGKYFIKNPT